MTLPLLNRTPAIASMVRGACPALATPMLTGDGLLARIGLDGGLRPEHLVRIGQLALRHGNGLIDISARGNIQVRGLTKISARALEDDIHRLNLPLRDGVPVETGVLAGMDPQEIANAEALAAAIRNFITEYGVSRRLAAKFSVVVDGGGQLPLHGLLADVRLVAVRRATGLFWRMHVGGTEGNGRVVGLVPDADAKTCATLVISRIAAMETPPRGRDLDPADVRAWLDGVVIDDGGVAVKRAPLTFGLLPLRSTARLHAARIGIPFGQCSAETLIELGQKAETAGIENIRPTIDHSLVFFGPEHACQAMIEVSNDLILSENDPRATIAACPGAPACASASLTTHALGHAVATDSADLMDGSFTLHLSGCGKGCAHPSTVLLGLVGMNDRTALIFNGKTSDMPLTSIGQGQEASAFAHLAALLHLERGAGETTRDCLLRLGPARVAEAFSQGQP